MGKGIFNDKTFTEANIHLLSQVLALEKFEQNQRIIQLGEKGDKFYLILKGRVSVWIEDKEPLEMRRSIIMSNASTSSLGKLNSSVKKWDFVRHELLGQFKLSEFTRYQQLNPTIQTTMKSMDTINDNDVSQSKQSHDLKEQSLSQLQKQKLKVVSYLGSMKTFGELAFLTNQPRQATIIAEQETYCATITKRAYKDAIKATHILNKDMIVEFIKQMPIFQRYSKGNIKKLARMMKSQKYMKEQVIQKEGDTDTKYMYIIQEGEFSIYQKQPEHMQLMTKSALNTSTDHSKDYGQQLAIYGKGNIVGEEQFLFAKTKASHTIICHTQPGLLYKIDLVELKKNFESHQDIVQNLKQMYTERQQQYQARMQKLHKQIRNINFVQNNMLIEQNNKDREKILSKKQIDYSLLEKYTQEEIITEKYSQQLINQFPYVNLKSMKRAMSKDNLNQADDGESLNLLESFEKSHRILNKSVNSLRAIKQLKNFTSNVNKLNKTLINQTQNMYKEEQMSKFKVQFYNQSNMIYEYVNQQKIDDIRRQEYKQRIDLIEERKRQKDLEAKKFRLKPYWQYNREKLLIKNIVKEDTSSRLSRQQTQI
ncbi:cyclic nucleotide-binding domain containing protein [Stylonychia lemnae]|uniref:Cyclic nucleotide-binding domain containing protein n=1 Tax=Stylonychia lemnae TaxID=5949 RepID=A0A078AJS4_STYLE|nr:cyclic nucleotide-binding domain containing protein [Stylonychia lemnae]|eukprot:CDW82419.1 cyclic nucleotide-binding domain containing protein [Stylonychia lemnae]